MKSLKLFSLEKRRLRGDLIEVFKLLNGLDKIDVSKIFEVNSSNTRGHSLKIFKKQSRCDIRMFFFSQRVVNHWNGLPNGVVTAPSLTVFKNKLDLVLVELGVV